MTTYWFLEHPDHGYACRSGFTRVENEAHTVRSDDAMRVVMKFPGIEASRAVPAGDDDPDDPTVLCRFHLGTETVH